MEVAQVLRMKEGEGETSYANNSQFQRNVISMTKFISEEAITKLYSSTKPRWLAMADLGCASGPNTLFVVSELIEVVEKLRRELGQQSPEYQVFLNDLPGNDFNSIFKSLPGFLKKMSDQLGPDSGPYFFSGVPGSFYGRLFPSRSLHFVHSSYGLHWLSQTSKLSNKNKGNICIATTSPRSVLQEYYQQFQRDFSIFLKSRAKELMTGGKMVITLQGRSIEDLSNKDCCYIWELLAIALNDMVSEGLIEEEKLDSFIIPQYSPSPSEVKAEVIEEGSFSIDCLEISKVYWNDYDNGFNSSNVVSGGGHNLANCLRAIVEPLLVSHFEDTIIEEVFHRYRKIICDCLSKEKNWFTNITISMTRKE